MQRRTWLLLCTSLALAGCAVSPPPRGGTPSALGRPAPTFGSPITAQPVQAPRGRVVTLLAPLTGPNAERGQSLVNGARLALSTPDAPPLDVRDTAGTPEGALAAADAAIAAGTGMIIGPLTAGETAAVASRARPAGVPVLAFTSDAAQAQPGVWPLGITAAQQMRRVVAALAEQDRKRIAAILPESDFGRAMAAGLQQAASQAGLPAPDIRFHDGSTGGINRMVRNLAQYETRRGPIEAQRRAALARRDAEGRAKAAELVRTPIPPPPIDALVLADTGEALGTIVSLLPYYDLDAPAVQVVGPALWSVAAGRIDAAMLGAWYAAPDPAARTDFSSRYSQATGAPAPGLADFAYDAAAVARVLDSEGRAGGGLTRPEGFAGVDGVFGLQPDGSVRRGLALFRLERGGPVMAEPAPDTLGAPGI